MIRAYLNYDIVTTIKLIDELRQTYMVLQSPVVLLFFYSENKITSLRELLILQQLKAMQWPRSVLFYLFFSLKK